MKTCYLVSYNGLSNAGGVEKVCYYLSNIMSQKGYRVVIIHKNFIENTKLGKLYHTLFGKIHIVGFTFFASLYVKVTRERGDIIIAHGFNAPFFKIDYLFVHGTMKGYSLKTNTTVGKKTKMLFYLERMAVKNAEKILAVSQNAVDEVKQFYNNKEKSFYIVNNGVDSSIFFPKKTIASKDITILYCGRLDYGKGLYDLMKLAKDIESRNGYRFKIACNNLNNKYLFEGLHKTEIKVGLTIEDINDFYNSGDVLFFPSLYEGFEMVTLEALSAGIPVLGNNVGAVSELVRNNEPGVELINKTDIFGQIDKITEKFENQKDFLHQYYTINYGLETYSRKLNSIIN